jgi:hypothetical protein
MINGFILSHINNKMVDLTYMNMGLVISLTSLDMALELKKPLIANMIYKKRRRKIIITTTVIDCLSISTIS